jgi:hypothetical protein
MKGTVSLSWGPSVGAYAHRHRLSLGPVALTRLPGVEIDDLIRGFLEREDLRLPLNAALAVARSTFAQIDAGDIVDLTPLQQALTTVQDLVDRLKAEAPQ